MVGTHWLERISPRPNVLWRGRWAARYVEASRYLYDHELVLVTQGELQLRVQTREWVMKAGTFVIIPPNVLHSSSVLRAPVYRFCLHFDWTSIPAPERPICSYLPDRPPASEVVRTPAFVPKGCQVGAFHDDGRISALLETLFFRWQTGESVHRALCRPALLELLLLLLAPGAGPKRTGEPPSRLAYAVKELLDTSAPASAGVQSLLASLGCSYAHACRTFHRYFGLTPGDYLNTQRLERAKILLANPRLAVAEVGYQSGFNDAGYFCRKFREKTGMTPGSFRATLKV